jgi:carbamoylphosphate synthase small subunit
MTNSMVKQVNFCIYGSNIYQKWTKMRQYAVISTNGKGNPIDIAKKADNLKAILDKHMESCGICCIK